jgi:hypothetical protein
MWNIDKQWISKLLFFSSTLWNKVENWKETNNILGWITKNFPPKPKILLDNFNLFCMDGIILEFSLNKTQYDNSV